MTIIDYLKKDNLEEIGAKLGANGTVILEKTGEKNEVIFKNFPHLVLSWATLKKCRFENCKVITVAASEFVECEFDKSMAIHGSNAYFFKCRFHDSLSMGAFLTIERKGDVVDCVFESIDAQNFGYAPGYIVYIQFKDEESVKKTKRCRFVDCRAENDEGKMTELVYYVKDQKSGGKYAMVATVDDNEYIVENTRNNISERSTNN